VGPVAEAEKGGRGAPATGEGVLGRETCATAGGGGLTARRRSSGLCIACTPPTPSSSFNSLPRHLLPLHTRV